MGTRVSNLLREVMLADKDWQRDSRVVTAYKLPNGREFTERTATSGPYAPEEEEDEEE